MTGMATSKTGLLALAVSATLGLTTPIPCAAEGQALPPAAIQFRLIAAADSGPRALRETAAELARRHPDWQRSIAFETLALTLERAIRQKPEDHDRLLREALAAAESRALLTGSLGRSGSAAGLRARAAAARDGSRNKTVQLAAPAAIPSLSQWTTWSLGTAVDDTPQRLAQVAQDRGPAPAPVADPPTQLAQAVFADNPEPQIARGWPTEAQPARSPDQRRRLWTGLTIGALGGGVGALALSLDDNIGAGEGSETEQLPIATDENDNPLGAGDETANSAAFRGIGGQAAFDFQGAVAPQGLSGQGVTVAVLGAGIAPNHPEFVFNLDNETPQFTVDREPTGQGRERSTATAAASIIAGEQDGSGLHGIAPRARLISLREIQSNGARLGSISSNGFALRGAEADIAVYAFPLTESDVSVGQLSSGAVTGATFLTGTAGSDLMDAPLLVMPTGDDGAAEPQIGALVPLYDAAAEGFWIAAAALDAEGTDLADFSNACGAAAAWCITAPGEGILAAVDVADLAFDRASYAELSSTVAAAASVGGALAILRERFPELSLDQARQILLDSARDLGAPGIDPVFGHGAVDLAAAIQPQGGLSAVIEGSGTAGEMTVPLQAGLSLSPAFGAGVMAELAGRTISLRDGRGLRYGIDASRLVTIARDRLRLSQRLSDFGRNGLEHLALNQRISVGYRLADEIPDRLEQKLDLAARDSAAHGPDLERGMLRYDFASGGMHVAAYQGVSAGLSADLALDPDRVALRPDPAAGSAPYLQLSGDSWASTIVASLGTAELLALGFQGEDGSGGLLRVTSGPLALQGGTISETNGVLGGRFEDGFALAAPGRTVFGGIRLGTGMDTLADRLDLSRIELSLAAHAGLSRFTGATGSLIEGTQQMLSSAFAMEISAEGLLRPGDGLLISLYQPLRVEQGGIDFAFSEERIDAAPEGRELALAGSYGLSLGDTGRLSAGLVLRRQANHQADRAMAAESVMRWETLF